jgi:hypothetical protein
LVRLERVGRNIQHLLDVRPVDRLADLEALGYLGCALRLDAAKELDQTNANTGR